MPTNDAASESELVVFDFQTHDLRAARGGRFFMLTCGELWEIAFD